MTNGWISNNPKASALLRAADAAYERAKGNASNLPLAEKVVALAAAKQIREAAYTVASKI